MRVLDVERGLLAADRSGADVLLAVRRCDVLPRRILGGVADANGVGAHVGDESGRPAAAEVDAFIQLLRDAHRSLRRHAEPRAGVLLERARRVRSLGKARSLLDLDRLHDERRRARGHCSLVIETQCRNDLFRLGLSTELELLALCRVLVAAPADESRGERVDAIFDKKRVDRPRLDRHEGIDLHLPVDNEAHRDRLHPAR